MKISPRKTSAKQIIISVDNTSGGSNSLLDEARMNPKFAVDSTNLMQVQDGLWKTRWGTQYYGADYGANPDGGCEFVKSDGTTELIIIANGKAYKSTDGGSITEITGATFTAGNQCYFLQMGGYDSSGVYHNYLYIANGVDTLTRYNGTTLETYTEINAPTNLTASLVASGLASGTYTYYAQVTALNDIGETVGSTEATIAVNKLRENWTSTTDKVTWSWTASAGAKRYQLYISDASGFENYLANTTATSFIDDGTVAVNPYVFVPNANTTGAPKFKAMCMSNGRIFATNNSNDMYTVYFSGVQRNIGIFSEFYGGGTLNLEGGGREIPVTVKHYQAGSGDGRATVLCKTPDGRGAVWQIQIVSTTVGSTQFFIPSATKVVGSFGTESLLGIVATENDIYFPNRKGWFSLGPERQYYGILRTKEQSSNIRPYWRSLVGNKISGICSYFYDAKIFISVPKSTTGNNKIIIYDTERSNWAVDWSIGAKQFFEYADTAGNNHFLYIPISGNKLIELSENFLNDLGSPFSQSYISPLIPVSKDKTDILNLMQAVLELGRPRGVINFQILGVGKDSSFTTIATRTITDFGSNTGVDTDLADECLADETQASVSGGADAWAIYLIDSPSTFSQATTKGAIKKRAKIYALQFKVSSSTADTDFTILSLQAKGRLIPGRLPSAWTN